MAPVNPYAVDASTNFKKASHFESSYTKTVITGSNNSVVIVAYVGDFAKITVG
jgi:hypothetical protein